MAEQSLPSGNERNAATSTHGEAGRSLAGARQPGGLVGRRLGHYDLRAVLGVGGMAEVYRAYDNTLLREVAVKVLTGPLAQDASYVDHFRNEARRVAALSSPHLVPVYQAGEEVIDGQRLLFLVMPLLQESLHDLLKREGRLPYAEAVWLALQVAEGLEAAHRLGLVHRDVKPENILLDAEGQALLGDFGVARDLRFMASQGPRHTWTGLAVGTPEYMAPEQLRGEAVDQRADVYALGAVLYEMLTGKVPFSGETPYEIASHALNDTPIPPSALVPGIPAALERVVLAALARDPDERYPDMSAFSLALRRAVSQQPESNAAFATSATIPVSSPALAKGSSGVHRNAQPNHRWMVVLALAAVLLVGLGGAFAAFQRGGNATALSGGLASGPSNGGSTSQPTVPVEQPSPTSASGSGSGIVPTAATTPGATPGATPAGTGTPSALATPTPIGTATQTATTQLSIAPMPLVLTASQQGKKTCGGTQTIRNDTSQMVGWSWQGPPKPGFHFQIDGRPQVNWPTATTTTPPGGQDTLAVSSDCKTKFATVVVNDSLGNQYTFAMTVSGS